MLNRTGIVVLGVLAVAGVGAAIVATRSGSESGKPEAAAGSVMFPELASKAGDVAEIDVKRAPMAFTIRKEGDAWRVVDKAGYPAKLDTVRAVVVGLGQLKREEEKTSVPEQYSKLGVEDPVAPPPDAADKPVPQSALLTLKDSGGQTITSAVLGNPKYGGMGATGVTNAQMYIRKPGEKAAWLVSGQVDVPREPLGWIETKFADIKRDRIRSVVVTHPDGSVVTVSRDKQADAFAVRDVPAGRELKDPGVGETIASTLTGLAFQDVAPAATVQAKPEGDIKPGPTIVVRTFDGLIVTAKSVIKESKAWWAVSADVDESLAAPPPPPEKPADGKEPEKPAAPAVGTLEALRKEATELNAMWSSYAFAPADWKVRSINSQMSDLLKEPTAPASPAPSANPIPGSPSIAPMPMPPPSPAPASHP